jgi:surface polysaccharide O-acyltransferase-like enzyme
MGKRRLILKFEKKDKSKMWKEKLIGVTIIVCACLLIGSLLLIGKSQEGPSPAWYVYLDFFVIFAVPAFPLFYGYLSQEKAIAILMGILPMGIPYFLFALAEGYHHMYFAYEWFGWWLVSFAILGLEGYFASKRRFFTLIAIILYLIWIFWFFTGID